MALISDDCKNLVLKPTYPVDSDLATRELIDKFVQTLRKRHPHQKICSRLPSCSDKSTAKAT